MIELDINRLGMANVERLAGLFFQSAEQLKSELIAALNRGDFEKIEKLAHKMNGAAGNFGLERLCALLAGIETEAGQGVAVTAASRKRFETEYNAAVAALDICLSQQGKPSGKRVSYN